MNYATKTELKNALTSVLQPYNFSQSLISQLLSDEFISGTFELLQNEPENDELMTFARNFSEEQNLGSLIELKNKFAKEFQTEGYFTSIFQYVIDSWRGVDFSVDSLLLMAAAHNGNEENITPEDVKKANIVTDVVMKMLEIPTPAKTVVDETFLWGKITVAVHNQEKKIWEILDRMDAELWAVATGVRGPVSTAEDTRSPLIVDLDGDGVETTTLEKGVHFDHDGNGFAEKTAWVGRDDGLLVRDINGNGQIDDGTELFGNNTVLSNGQKAANGFEALKDLDSNNDGQFNSSDAAWNEVKVWKDTNQNGKIDDGELLTLEQAGINSINLDYQNSDITDINGNKIGQTGSFDKENGTKGNISDVWFNTDLMNTLDKTQIDIPDDIKALPNIIGFGNVHDLHTAMALDTTGALKNLVQQYTAETDISARQNILYNIIYYWTGVQNMDPDGRDPTQVYGKVIDDTRKLEALEEFMGKEYLGTWCWGERDPNPHAKAAPYILRAFEILADYVNCELLAQTHYKPLMEEIKLFWNETTQSWDIDVSSAVTSIQNIYNADANKGILVFREFENLVKSCGYSGLQKIYDAFRLLGDENGNILDVMISKFGLTYGTELDDKLTGTVGVDDIQGLAGNDSIYGGAGNDTLDGGDGHDNIFGEEGDDILIGGAGNDYLIGGNGADTYIFNPGFGHDAIDNSDDNASDSEPDIIQFGEGILPSKTTLGRQGYDLIITVSYEPDEDGNILPNDSIRVYSYFDQQGTSSATINSIMFADGTSWDYNYVRDHWNSIPGVNGGVTLEGNNEDNEINGTQYNDILIGNGGNDTINAGSGNDCIVGGAGNDTLNGGYGDDTYLWNWGDGMDTIIDNGNHDKISFGSGISYTDLKFRQEGYHLRITVKNNEAQGMFLSNFFYGLDYKIEDLYFHDGSIVHLSEIPLTLHQLNTDETINLTGNGDTVYGNDGNDTINGGQGNDTIIGGKGDDIINGGSGADTYIWNLGDGLDTLVQASNSDTIMFGPGITFNDLTFRNDDGDLRIYVGGNDEQGVICKNFFRYNDYKSKQILFNDGTSFALPTSALTLVQKNTGEAITATIYNDTIYANGGNDTVYAGDGNDTIYGGAGFDTIYGENGNDTLIGGKGNDSLYGGAGDDTYIYNIGDGLDTIYDYQNSSTESRADKILFGEGITFDDLTFRREGDNLIITLFGDCTQGMIIERQFYDDNRRIEYLEFADGTVKDLTQMGFTFQQTDAHDNISGTDYDDVIYGNGGNDTIYGNAGNDVLIGGKGNDYLNGGNGADTYVWNLGDGLDKIEDYQYGEEGQHDRIKFGEGIAFDDLTFERDGDNLNIYVKGDRTQGLQLHHQFYNNEAYRIEYLEFADGTVKNLTQMGFTFQQTDADDNVSGTDYDDVIYGNGGNDTIYGNAGNDVLIGGKGNDYLNGGNGADTYIWNLGDGFDKIEDYQYGEEGQHDRIKFGEGIAFDDLTFERDGDNLNIYVNGDRTQGLQLHHQFYNESYRIEYLEFADGTVKDLTQMGFTFQQTDLDDNVSGTDYDDIIYANGGNDTIHAGNGNDTIYGGDGHDTINGDNGDDILVGGKGNDRLDGGYGNDTFIYNLGDGFDVISDSGDEDKIVFGEGITFDDLTFERNGNHLNVYINGDKTQGFQLYNQFYSSSNAIETLEFADGSSVKLTEIGLTFNQNDYDEDIHGTDYDDVIYGKGGNDTIQAGNGNDTIYGGDGHDTINGDNGDDILVGGKGNDRLDGGYGNDTFIYNLGDGFDVISDSGDEDKIILGEGVAFDDLTFERNGNHLNVYINGDKTQGFQLYNQFYSSGNAIETLEFADGSSVKLTEIGLTFNQNDYAEDIHGTDYNDVIYAEGGNDTIHGGNGNDTIYGGDGHDTIYGDNGDDILVGGKGNDRLDGGYGNDTFIYNLGDGFDVISDSGDEDKIILGEGVAFDDLTFERNGNHLNVYINGDKTQGFQLYNQFYSSSNAIETLEFADGSSVKLTEIGLTLNQNDYAETILGTDYNDIIYGKGGNDTIQAGDGDDILSGGTGHDRLEGGAGNDTYLWNLGDGIDTISDNQGNNKIKFGTGISADDLSFAKVGNNLRIIIDNKPEQGLIIENYYYESRYQIDTIEFADGSTASIADLNQNLVSLPDLVINGTDDDDILTGGNGCDTINAGDGYNDITGGKGNDILNGGYDKDTYYYNRGDGYDIISDPYGRDKIIFGEGISLSDVVLQRDGNDLLIAFKNNDNDSIRVSQHFYQDDYRMEQLEFADGSVMNLTKGLTLYGMDKADTITGTNYGDIIYGGSGDDTINGGAGADTIIGGPGDDNIDGGTGEDTIVWNFGDGLDTVSFSDLDHLKFGEGITFEDLTFYEEGNNLRIVVKGDMNQGLICQNYFYSNDRKFEDIIFHDGSTFPMQNSGLIIHHDDSSESISGTDYDDTIHAGNGDNSISGGDGDDIIFGQDGNDNISGGNGDDIIVGGKGNDVIYGNGGSNTYIWNLGDDLDTITASNIDKLQFGEGITLQNLSFRSEGNNLHILVNNDETQGIVLVNFFYSDSNKLNFVSFADGNTFNLATSGLTFDQHISAHDTIHGTIYDDVINAQNTYSVTIDASYGNDIINAGDGNDTINAGDGNDIISGGKGNDILNGGYGDDTYLYNLGDGFDTISDSQGNDKIVFGEGISFADLSFRQYNNSLIININNNPTQGFEIVNYFYSASQQIEELQFADGTRKLLSQIDMVLQQGDHDETINGTNSNETIYGNGGNDVINGGYGNDIIIGGKGNDTLNGGGDDDTYVYNLGDGLDTISDNAGSNKIVFGEGITQDDIKFTQIGNNLLIYLNDDKNQGMIINNFFSDDAYKISEIHFADNSVFYLSEAGLTLDQSDRTDNMTINGTDFDDILIGGIGNDTINAGDDDDILIGGKGNDTLNGGYGRDTYVYNLGDGMDIINETRGNDKIKFGNGITKDDLTFTQEGNNLRIIINNDINQSILINGFYENVNYQVENIEFADGSKFNLSTQGLTLQQTNADDNVNGTSYDDIIYGNGGHDTINAGDGNDILIGGLGNDILSGGYGDDTYVYNLGDGLDVINESGGNDRIVFGEGISQDNLSFERINDNLKISINGDEIKGIQINNQFGSTSERVEILEFHDGSTLDISNADQLVQAMSSFSLSNSASTDTLSNPTQDVSEMYGLAANSELNNKAV